ncbi:DNA cytosine methyltransferase [Microbacterium sp. CFBP 8794]|uniref:DNA cytosine methyltransferase n=1 Tax=Microbacterium sp. CFBP 8794 TaxID=2775269 RepID=UPI00177E86D7|nr:DNA cytosine methyltransferase [Microbacterium sp. CFBP 8794]MBD8479365.1 DNA cytosine methyltransferase [Microbacterium sp. CFBP 8794]
MMAEDSPRAWRAAEFFAGIGLARLGMSKAGIDVVWSNDIAPTKHAMFKRNFGTSEDHTFLVEDLGKVAREKLPENTDIAWASFPCTDLSVAGGRAGLHRGIASSTFWHFIKALSKLGSARPPVIALENVTAFATSHSGQDIASAIRSLNGLGYSVDVLSIDARRFVPQSRPRLFLIGTSAPVATVTEPSPLRPDWLAPIFDDPALVTHKMRVPEPPPLLADGLVAYLETLSEDDPRWWSTERVDAFVGSLSDLQSERFNTLRDGKTDTARTAYRRMRQGTPRWELRSDGIAGCLRTSSGGSSKQAVVFLGRGDVRIRWMTPREYASLMGAPEYLIDGVKEHHAYSGFGDAVCAPVVEWLSANYLVPLLASMEVDVIPDETRQLESVAS